MRLLLLSAALVALADPAASQTTATLQAKARAKLPELRTQFDDHLLDYTSARFKAVRAGFTEIGNAPYFCGQVNAKNNSGAYVGWRFFAWQSWSTEGLVMETADGDEITAINRYCADYPDPRDPTDYSAALAYKAP